MLECQIKKTIVLEMDQPRPREVISFFKNTFGKRQLSNGGFSIRGGRGRRSPKICIDAESIMTSPHSPSSRSSNLAPVATVVDDSHKENEGDGIEYQEVIQTLTDLSVKAFTTSVSYFIIQALKFRRGCPESRALFKDIVEEFIVSSAPLELEFLSSQVKHTVVQCYISQPFLLLTQRTPELERYCDHYSQEELPSGVFDEAIVEAMNFIYTSLKKQDLPVQCLYQLHSLIFSV